MTTQLSIEQQISGVPAARAWTALLRAHAALTARFSALLQSDHRLTINAYEALLRLSRAEDERMKRVDLARSLMLTPSGVTRMLDGLQDAGLVEPDTCDTDRRIVYACLTRSGREKLEAATEAHVAAIREVFGSVLSDREVERLADLLDRLPGAAEQRLACEPEAEAGA